MIACCLSGYMYVKLVTLPCLVLQYILKVSDRTRNVQTRSNANSAYAANASADLHRLIMFACMCDYKLQECVCRSLRAIASTLK